MMHSPRGLYALLITVGALLGSCDRSEGSDATRLADFSSADAAVNTGMSLLHVRLLRAGERQSVRQNDVTAEFVLWDMELIGQRLGYRDRPYPMQMRFHQGLSAYNHRDMVGGTFGWTGGTQRPVLTEGARYLLVGRGVRSGTSPVEPITILMVPLDAASRTTEPLFDRPAGTPIDEFMPPGSLTPPATDADGGERPGDAGVGAVSHG